MPGPNRHHSAAATRTAAALAGRRTMTCADPDAIADALSGISGRLLKDQRTAALALRLDDLRRDIGRALANDGSPVRNVLSETALQAMMQGGADRALTSA